MKSKNAIAFPLERPTYYLACIADEITNNCTHVSFKFSPPMLAHLLWMHFVASVLRLVGIKISVFRSDAGALCVACLGSTRKQALKTYQEISTDEDPYSCLSIAELISLGGYAMEAALSRYFTLANRDMKLDSLEVHVASRMMWFRLHFCGANPSLETDPFNLGIIVRDIVRAKQMEDNKDVTKNR